MLTHSFTVPKYFIPFIGITLLGICFGFLGSEQAQNTLSILGILSIGILHGANDLKIIAKKSSQQEKENSLPFFVLYIGVVFLGVVVFYFIPAIALLCFVLVSCYHFGEQHWNKRFRNRSNPFIFFSLYGALIFMMLFALQYEATVNIIFQITAVDLPHSFFWLGSIVSFFGFCLCAFMEKIPLKVILMEFLLLGLLALLFLYSNLLFGFGLYFVLWHSFPSLQSQIQYIYGSEIKNSALQYIKSALWYWVLALLGLFLFYSYVNLPQEYLLSLFFSFLAAITFPHALVMGLMFHSKESNAG